MTATTLGGTTVPEIELAFPRPAWAGKTHYPEEGSHTGTVTVGPITLTLGQDIIPFTCDDDNPIYVWLPEVDRVFGAQACRDIAAALLEAARIIEAAAS
jgi:hypothetical protein